MSQEIENKTTKLLDLLEEQRLTLTRMEVTCLQLERALREKLNETEPPQAA